MSAFDSYLNRLPGSMPVKAFATAVFIAAACAYPIFGGNTNTNNNTNANNTINGKQGHDYFSQERPEAILQGQEQMRKQYLRQREQQKQQERAVRAKAAEQTKEES